jgi:hypothetical protein
VVGAGWARIGPDARIAAWAKAALPLAKAAIAADGDSWRCGGTWHVGLDALPNGPDGGVGEPFPWEAFPLEAMALHRGQVSTIHPGYPQPWDGESDAAFAYRRDRDAAHLDGLLPIGPQKRRFVKEPHAWVLWEGSHLVMQAAMARAFAGHPPDTWANVDVTDAYTAARREVFATCRRVTVPLKVGEASLIHRHMLHGMAPWGADTAPPEGRMIAYFRPMLPSVADWLAN